MSWIPTVQALLDPIAFDRRPLDGLERVLAQKFGPGTSEEAVRATVDALREASASNAPLGSVVTLSHGEDEVRTYLDAIRARLEERVQATASTRPPPAERSLAADLMALLESSDPDALDALDQRVEDAIDTLGEVDDPDMQPWVTGRDLELQGLGLLLEAIDEARAWEIDRDPLHRVAASELGLEAEGLITRGRGLHRQGKDAVLATEEDEA
jgi:hypothetical protein